ncbi:MAG: outer membrane lipoprotein carrier protein LolA [Rhodospirillaceae bacterium]
MCKQRGFVALILAVTIMAVMIVMVDMALPAQAEVTAAKLSQSELADIERVEHALNQIKTLQAKFLQVADNGRHSAGTFSMWRPGRMRLNYDPPIKDYIVADGWFIFFWDGELQQQSSQPIDASLADFFLRETIKLSGDVTVTRFSHQFGVIEVAIVQTTDAGQGELTMVFEDKPLQLRAWRVLDAQGLTTTVTLSDVRTGMKFSDDLFLFRDPTIGRPSKR